MMPKGLYATHPDLPRRHQDGCPSCGKNLGRGVDGRVELDGVVWTCNCRDQLQRHKFYLSSGIGATYQFLCWRDFVGDPCAKEEVQSYARSIRDMVASGRGLFLTSPQYGVGKTMLASLVAKESVMAGYDTYMTTFPDMLSDMKAGWHDSDFSLWYRRKIESARVLVIDDVGKEIMGGDGFNDKFSRQTMDSLVRSRVQQGKVTIMTSNMPVTSFRTFYGPAVVSLMDECMVQIDVGGSDFRASKKPPAVGHRRVW